MWTRSLLKQNAKQVLAGTYWRCFALCLLLTLAGVGTHSTQVTADYQVGTEELRKIWHGSNEVWTGNAPTVSIWDIVNGIPAIVWGAVLIAILVGLVLGVCWMAFITMPLEVGRNRFFMENRQSPAPMGTLTTVFRTPYLNVVKVRFLVALKIALGSIIIVPGIYWAYCYWMVPYLLAENPYMTTTRAMELSSQMMYGEKWRTFVLCLSFIGWTLLCVLTLGLGRLFLEPYYQATMAELYAALRAKAFAMNLTDSSELGGFVRH